MKCSGEEAAQQQKKKSHNQNVIQTERLQISLAQKHAMVETVRKKWTADKPTAGYDSQPTASMTNLAVDKYADKQKMSSSKKKHHSRPAPLNEIDEVYFYKLIIYYK